MSKSYGQLRTEYARRKDEALEAQAKIDMERLRRECPDSEFWASIEAEAPSLDEVFPHLEVVESGIEDIQPRYKGDTIRNYVLPGTFPRRYWLLAEVDEDEVSDFGTNSKSLQVYIDEPARPRMGKCERCQREVKPQYRYCYRCHNYLKVKARIQAA